MQDRPIFLSRLSLPLSWEALDRAPSHEECESAAWANAGAIGFLLHSIDLDAAQRPADERLAEALAPLRIKLDIVIEMLGRLTYHNVALPPVYAIEFGLNRLAWRSPLPLRPGDWLRLRLYFDPKFLEAIVLFGCVASTTPDDATGACRVQAELLDAPLDTEEAIARLAFLAQRRQLVQRPAQTVRVER